MSIEPNARRRLQLVYATTRDPELLKDLRQVLEEDHTMSFVPSGDLLRDIALCAACIQDGPRAARAGLCDDHRARWNIEACMADTSAGEDLVTALVHGVFDVSRWRSTTPVRVRPAAASPSSRARSACAGRGAIAGSIAETVERACTMGPRFLTGGELSAVQQAS